MFQAFATFSMRKREIESFWVLQHLWDQKACWEIFCMFFAMFLIPLKPRAWQCEGGCCTLLVILTGASCISLSGASFPKTFFL